VFRRIAEGESRRAMAVEYGISEASIRGREEKTGKTADVQKVARMMVETESAYKSLPISAQISARNLADKLKSISHSLASAADLGAKTAHRLHALANSEVEKVDDAEPMSSLESLKGVSALTKLANDSASIALNLLSANKETVRELNAPTLEGGVSRIERTIVDPANSNA
jgi:hypothetical protein